MEIRRAEIWERNHLIEERRLPHLCSLISEESDNQLSIFTSHVNQQQGLEPCVRVKDSSPPAISISMAASG